jgi:membrane protease YdiL (CAAX protease family)
MRRNRKDWLVFGAGKSYLDRVHHPLQCLIFITPLLLFYQIGSALDRWPPDQATPTHVVAFKLMLDFFKVFGAAGNFLPLLAVVAILLAWHLARKDPWDFDPRLYAGMAGESIVWAIPIYVAGLVMVTYLHPAAASPAGLAWLPFLSPAAGATPLPWQTQIVLSVGAGIYEELLFRLIAITLLNIILVDVLELKIPTAIPVIIIISAVLFSAYHYLGNEPFDYAFFVFRTAMGIYLAGIYIYRGFGIAVGCHAVYDLILVGVDFWRTGH